MTLGGRRVATSTHRNPELWLQSVRKGHGEVSRETLDPAAQGLEYLMMCLRLQEGLSLSRHTRLAGQPLDPARIGWLAEQGLIEITDDRLRATATGRLLLNRLLVELSGP